jgi:hypothetical protein
LKDEINSAYNGEPLTNRVVIEELLERRYRGKSLRVNEVDPVTTDSKEETLMDIYSCHKVTRRLLSQVYLQYM